MTKSSNKIWGRYFSAVKTLIAAAVWFAAGPASAMRPPPGLGGLDSTATTAGIHATGWLNLPTIIGRYINVAVSLVGVLMMSLMVYAGFLWMTAGGNEEQLRKAKTILTGAIIGAILVFGAYAITYFVIQSTGS